MQIGKDIMSLHQQEFSHFRLSTLEDIKYLAPRLRQEDKQEILAGTGLLPYEVSGKGLAQHGLRSPSEQHSWRSQKDGRSLRGKGQLQGTRQGWRVVRIPYNREGQEH